MKYILIVLFIGMSGRGFSQTNLPDLNQFAAKTVDRYFLAGCVQGSTYAWNKFKETYSEGGYTIWEFKKFNYTIVLDSLTEEDKLNGYAWKGKLVITASAYREYMVPGPNSSSVGNIFDHWLEWKTFGNMKITDLLEKKKGECREIGLETGPFLSMGQSKPSCAAIGGLGKK